MNIFDKYNIQNQNDYKDFFTEDKIKELEKIMEEVEKDIFFPNPLNIFRFTAVPIKKIKCIFIGQDAYPSYKLAKDEEKDLLLGVISEDIIDKDLGFLNSKDIIDKDLGFLTNKENIEEKLGKSISENVIDDNLNSSNNEDLIENNWEEKEVPTKDSESITITENKNPATETIIIEKDWEEEGKSKEESGEVKENKVKNEIQFIEERIEEEIEKAKNDKNYFNEKDNLQIISRNSHREAFQNTKEIYKDIKNKKGKDLFATGGSLYIDELKDREKRIGGIYNFKDIKTVDMDKKGVLDREKTVLYVQSDELIMIYKGYIGTVEKVEDQDMLCGRMLNGGYSVYYGYNLQELVEAFEKAVEFHIQCNEVVNKIDAMISELEKEDNTESFYSDDEYYTENNHSINKEEHVKDSNSITYSNYSIETPIGPVVPEATGRSFEVNSMVTWTDKIKQSSLRNILKSLYYLETGEKKTVQEIREEIFSGNFSILPPHEWFDYLETQGVVFLNTSLTVKMDKAGSHLKLWESFMNDLVKYIDSKNPEIKWILAGKVSQERITPLISYSVQTDHPRLDSFVTQCPFAQVDDVDWIGKDRGRE